MSRDMICVYHAADVEQGEILVTWLTERGIEPVQSEPLEAPF